MQPGGGLADSAPAPGPCPSTWLNAKSLKIISQLNFSAYLSERCSGARIILQVAFQAENSERGRGSQGGGCSGGIDYTNASHLLPAVGEPEDEGHPEMNGRTNNKRKEWQNEIKRVPRRFRKLRTARKGVVGGTGSCSRASRMIPEPGTQGPAIESEFDPRSKGVRNPIQILIWIIAASANYGAGKRTGTDPGRETKPIRTVLPDDSPDRQKLLPAIKLIRSRETGRTES